MTKAEIAKMRSAFIDSMDKKMLTMTTAAEQRLLNAIIDKLFQTIGSNAESVLSDSGKVLKLSQAIENIFTNFKQSDEASIIREMIKGVSSIMSLNQQYFAKFDEQRLANYNKVFSDVDKQIKNRIGISEDGSIIKSGFLYRLMNDTTLQNKVIELTQKAEAQNWTTKDYLSQIRKTIVGDETIAGGITQHYRTFANDVHSQIDRAAAYGLAKGLGLRAFVYEGGLIETSREFCDKKDGKVFTIEETEQWKNDPDLLLTSDEKKGGVLQYDPIVDMGRWNCRHMESWIDKDQAIKMRPELKAYYKNGFVIEKVVEQTPPPKVDVVPLPPPPPPAPVVEPPVVLAQNDTVSQSMENIIQLDSDGIVLLRDNSFSGITTSKMVNSITITITTFSQKTVMAH